MKDDQPVYGRLFQTPFADKIRNEIEVPTIAVGAISEADHANSIIAAGRADLCAIARPHLADPSFVLHEAAKIGYAEQAWPKQYLSARAAIHQQSGPRGAAPTWQMSMTERHALSPAPAAASARAIALALAEARPSRQPCGRRAEPLEAVRGEITAAGGEAFVRRRLRRHRCARAWPTRSPRRCARSATSPCWSTAPARRLPRRSRRPTWRCGTRVIGINLTGTFLVTQAALPSIRRAGNGRIVNIASTAGLTGYAYVSAYCAAKHGVIGLTRALALELARTDVTVNAVCPGFTDTPLLDGAIDTIVAKTGRSRGRGAREPRARQSARAAGDAGGGGRRGALARFGKRVRDHRPGDPRRRRRSHGRLTMTNPMQDKKRPFKDHKAEHFLLRDRRRRPRRDHHAQPPRQEEPADLRKL